MLIAALTPLLLITSLGVKAFSYLPQLDQGIAILSSVMCPRDSSGTELRLAPEPCSDTLLWPCWLQGGSWDHLPFLTIVGPRSRKDQPSHPHSLPSIHLSALWEEFITGHRTERSLQNEGQANQPGGWSLTKDDACTSLQLVFYPFLYLLPQQRILIFSFLQNILILKNNLSFI